MPRPWWNRRIRRSGSPSRPGRCQTPRRTSRRRPRPSRQAIDSPRTALLRRTRVAQAAPGGNLMYLKPILCGVVLVALGIGCHHEVEMIPLVERTIYQTDRFYDVQAVSKQRAIVVGYGGKIVETRD